MIESPALPISRRKSLYETQQLWYTKAVANFVEENKRWPEPHEVALPKPKPDGVIKDVRLQDNGELRFTLTGLTISRFRGILLCAEIYKVPTRRL